MTLYNMATTYHQRPSAFVPWVSELAALSLDYHVFVHGSKQVELAVKARTQRGTGRR